MIWETCILTRMDDAQLRQILTQGETLTVEFKSRVSDKELVETVVCLANGRGGLLLIGVDDQGSVVGTEPRHDQVTDPARLQSLIAGRTVPSVETTVTVMPSNDREVIAVEVPVGKDVISTRGGKFLRRTLDLHGNPSCLPMNPHEVIGRAGSVGVLDYSGVVLPSATWSDLSDAEFSRFRESAGSGGDPTLVTLSDRDLLKALDLTDREENITVGALLLFGKESSIAEHLPTHEVGFQELKNLKVRVNEISRIPLLKAMLEISDRVRARNPEEEMDFGIQRIGLPNFAEVTIRELIANALIHRDYAAQGTTLAQISDGALTVSNPGGFPVGITVADLVSTPPRRRNPRLVDAFKRAGLVERTGRGIARVFEGQLLLGRPPPSYYRSNEHVVIARVVPGSADKEMVRSLIEARRNGQTFSLPELMEIHRTGELRDLDQPQMESLIMSYVETNGSITRGKVAELCQVDSTKAGSLLRRLRDQGKLRMEGARRTAVYVKA